VRSNVRDTNDKKPLINVQQQTSVRCLDASSELDRLRQENELLKIGNDDLKRQIEQWKESTPKPNNKVNTLEEIIDERDDGIDTLKKEIDGASDLSAATFVIAEPCHYASGLTIGIHPLHFSNDDGQCRKPIQLRTLVVQPLPMMIPYSSHWFLFSNSFALLKKYSLIRSSTKISF
jgi:hypothetical protein